MRTNSENSQLYNPRVSGMRYNNVVLALSGTLIIPNDGPTLWLCDGGLSDRTVRLPQLLYEREVIVANAGTMNSLNVTDYNGAALVTVPAQAMGHFYAGASRWVWSVGEFTVSGTIVPTDVAGSTVLSATDVIVRVNGAGVVVLTLPTAAAWQTSSGRLGLPLSIYDVSGNAAANNITINPAGVETLSGLDHVTIDSNYGSFQLRPRPAGGWVF